MIRINLERIGGTDLASSGTGGLARAKAWNGESSFAWDT